MGEVKEMAKVKKILIAVVVLVAVLLVVVDIAVSGYLVDYAIGCSGDGGDRNAEEIIIETEGRRLVWRCSVPHRRRRPSSS